VQERFFNQLGGVITNLRKVLGPSLMQGFGELAATAGRFLRQFAGFLTSPSFIKFLDKLFIVTNSWIKNFGESLFGKRGFLQGLIAMGQAMMPFMERFGTIVLFALDRLAYLMFRLSSNKDTPGWLDRMAATLQLVIDLAFNLGDFLFVFLSGLDEAGGAEVIETISAALMELMFFLSSPVGKKAMEALVDLAKFGITSFTGLLIAILSVMAAFEVLGEFIKNTFVPKMIEGVKFFLQGFVDMATFLGVWIQRIIGWIVSFFVWLWNHITTTKNQFSSLASAVASRLGDVVNRIKSLPGTILSAVKNFGSLLVNAGRSLIQGLINGVNQKIDQLRGLLNYVAGLIGGFFGSSPAEEGPLSGKGWTKIRGQHMIQDLIEGIQSETPNLRQATTEATSNVVFGANSVQVNFQGQLPSDTQARGVGSAVGQGAANLLAARNTRLAVRTL
jgi:type IV secretory pathway VirB3-like protein